MSLYGEPPCDKCGETMYWSNIFHKWMCTCGAARFEVRFTQHTAPDVP